MRKRTIMIMVVFAMILVSGVVSAEVNPYIGISGSSKSNNGFESPLGFFGVEIRDKKVGVYVEHISSIPNRHDYGLNLVGANVYHKVENVELYGGFAIHNEQFDCGGKVDCYGRDFNDVVVRVGAEYNLFYTEIIDGKVFGGVKIKF